MTPDHVVQKAATPAGNLPKGRHQYVLFGIAIVIVGGILITDSQSSKPKAASLPAVNVAPASKSDIDRYARDLAEQQRRVKEAEAAALRAKASFEAQTASAAGAFSQAPAGQIPGQALVVVHAVVSHVRNLEREAKRKLTLNRRVPEIEVSMNRISGHNGVGQIQGRVINDSVRRNREQDRRRESGRHRTGGSI